MLRPTPRSLQTECMSCHQADTWADGVTIGVRCHILDDNVHHISCLQGHEFLPSHRICGRRRSVIQIQRHLYIGILSWCSQPCVIPSIRLQLPNVLGHDIPRIICDSHSFSVQCLGSHQCLTTQSDEWEKGHSCLTLSSLPDCTISTLVVLPDLLSAAILDMKLGSDCS